MPHLQERQILFPTLQKCKDTAEIEPGSDWETGPGLYYSKLQ